MSMGINKILIILALVMVLLAGGVTAAISDGLVHYWNFDSGSELSDVIGNLNAEEQNTPLWQADCKVGGCYQFDKSSSEYLNVSNNESIEFTDSYTISLWFYNTDGSASNRRMFSKGGAGEDMYLILRSDDKYRFGAQSGLSPQYIDSVTVKGEELNEWLNVVAVYDSAGDNLTIYNNGSFDRSISSTGGMSPSSYMLNFGCANTGDASVNECFNGRVDEVGIWNRSLTGVEVAAMVEDYDSGITPVPDVNYFEVTAKDAWDDSVLSVFNATINGTFYETSNGTIVTGFMNSEGYVFNLTVEANNYFTASYADYDTTSDLNVAFVGAQASFVPKKVINEAVIAGGNFTIDGNTLDNGVAFNITAGVFNVTYANENYTSTTQEFTIPALFNGSYDLENVSQFLLNMTAVTAATGASISDFNITVTSLDYSWSSNYTTSAGYVEVPALIGTYNVSIEAAGFAWQGETAQDAFNITNTNVEFTLYTKNSFLVTFYDESDSRLINFTSIEIFAYGSVDSVNKTTSNGSVYIDLLTPDAYTLSIDPAAYYSSVDKYVTITEHTFQNLTVYLTNSSITDNVTVTVTDEANSAVEGVIVELYKLSLPSNVLILVGSQLTDSNGEAAFKAVLNGPKYSWLVKSGSTVLFESENPLPILRSEVSIPVSSGFSLNNRWNTLYNTNYLFVKESNTQSKLSWSSNEVTYANITVRHSNGSFVGFNSTTGAGPLNYFLDNSSNASYVASAYFVIDGSEYFLGSLGFLFENNPESFDAAKWLLSLIILLIIAFIALWNPTVMLVFEAVALIALAYTSLLPLSKPIVISLVALLLFLAYLIGREA